MAAKRRDGPSLGRGRTFWWAALGTYLSFMVPRSYVEGRIGATWFAVAASASVAAALGVGFVYRTVRRHQGRATASGSTTAMLALTGWMVGAFAAFSMLALSESAVWGP